MERGIKDSRAVDTESLCIVAGAKVWSLRVDIHVLDHVGNIIDCAAIGPTSDPSGLCRLTGADGVGVAATITALLNFRRPDVTVGGDGEVVIHSLEEREPVPLSIHHIPICVSFGIFEGGALVVDPDLKEELVRPRPALPAAGPMMCCGRAAGVRWPDDSDDEPAPRDIWGAQEWRRTHAGSRGRPLHAGLVVVRRATRLAQGVGYESQHAG